MAVEDRGAEHRLEQVVREGHPANRGQPRLEARQESPPDRKHHQTQIPERHRDASQRVEQLTEEHRALPAPVAGKVPPAAESDERRAGEQSNRGEPLVEAIVLCRAQDSPLVKRHADQHQAAAEPEDEERQRAEVDAERLLHPQRLLPAPPAAVSRDLGVECRRIRRPLHLDLLGYLLREARNQQGGADKQNQQARHREERQSGDQQGPRPPAARQVHQTTADRVRHQDVADPEEVGVGQSERQQPAHAAVVPDRGPPAPRLDPVGKETDSGAEQQGKEREELLAGEQLTQGPDAEVDPREVAPRRRIAVRRDRHREELDVHHQDAQQRETAQHVQAPDPGADFSRLRRRVAHLRFLRSPPAGRRDRARRQTESRSPPRGSPSARTPGRRADGSRRRCR